MSYETINPLKPMRFPEDLDEREQWCIDRIREIDEEYRLRKEPYVKLWCDIKARKISNRTIIDAADIHPDIPRPFVG